MRYIYIYFKYYKTEGNHLAAFSFSAIQVPCNTFLSTNLELHNEREPEMQGHFKTAQLTAHLFDLEWRCSIVQFKCTLPSLLSLRTSIQAQSEFSFSFSVRLFRFPFWRGQSLILISFSDHLHLRWSSLVTAVSVWVHPLALSLNMVTVPYVPLPM